MAEKGIEKVLFPAFDYKAIKESIVMDAKRVQYKLNPDVQQAVYTPRTIIKFDLPAHDFLDLKNTTFNFNAKSTGSSDQACFNPFIECIIYKLSIYLGNGSDIVEQILNYNLDTSSIFKFKTSLNYGNTTAYELQGYGNAENRLLLARNLADDTDPNSAQGTRYVVNLLASGLFNGSNLRYLPMGPLAQINGYNRSLHIEIELADPSQCMQDFDPTPASDGKNYQLSEVYMNLEIVKAPSYETKLMEEIQNGRVIAIPLISTDLEPNQITAGRSGNITFPIMKQRQWVTGCKALFVPNYTNPASAYTWQWGRPENLQNYQYQILNQYFPPEVVQMRGFDNDANRFAELMKYFNKLKDYKDGTLLDNAFDYADSPDSNELFANKFTSVPFTINSPALILLDLVNSQVGYPYFIQNGSFEFSVENSGEYNIQLTYDGERDVTLADATLRYGLYDATAGDWVDECYADDPMLSGQTRDEQLTIDANEVNLIAGHKYSSRVQWTPVTGSVYSYVMEDASIKVELTENVTVYNNRNFCIGQTFKVFYDQDEWSFGDYIIDGVSTMQSSSVMLSMDLGQTSSQFSVFNFINFMKMIIIDKTGVKVYQ
jgi:hypothetical protein